MARRGVRRAGIVALAVMAVALVPSAAQAFSKAIWGPVYRAGVNQFPMYQRLGVKIYEIDLDWSQIAATRPADPADPHDRAYAWPVEVQQAVTQAGRGTAFSND